MRGLKKLAVLVAAAMLVSGFVFVPGRQQVQAAEMNGKYVVQTAAENKLAAAADSSGNQTAAEVQQESFIHDSFDQSLINDAIERMPEGEDVNKEAADESAAETADDGAGTTGSNQNTVKNDPYNLGNVDPYADDKPMRGRASMPLTGEAHVIGVNVDFPNDTVESHKAFSEYDDPEELQKAFGIGLDGTEYPSEIVTNQYNSLHDYYYRSTYGKLNIYGDAYDYHAEKAREDYEDSTELLIEVMAALDEDIDYTNYDADKDGRIDCFYMHIPFDETDTWASTWWSKCEVAPDYVPVLDGVSAGSTIVLNDQLSTLRGHQVVLHEIGHAFGFPDYYSQNKNNIAPNGLDGILTFDMMNQNVGDHNGFSKWVAGWLGEEDVTRVLANEYGVYAYRGQQEFQNNEDGSVTLDLGTFTNEDPTKTGGIIVVGNEGGAPFASYFLIQYDTYAGNQKVPYYSAEEGVVDPPIPTGFRVYRVQANLNQFNQLIHNNTTDATYNKLIELVDPDMNERHVGESAPSPGHGYNCMFFEGSSLSPVTFPSSNFAENINAGFTGITIEFLESGGDTGKVRISYSDEHKPEEKPLEIALTSKEAIPGGYHVEFTANQMLSLTNPYFIYATVSGDLSYRHYLTSFLYGVCATFALIMV